MLETYSWQPNKVPLKVSLAHFLLITKLQLTGIQRGKQQWKQLHMVAKIATEQVMDLRYTLRYQDVPIKSKSYMFGDTRSVVTSATLPHSTLSKRHNILAFHMVREAIVAKIIQSEYNLSDMLI